jgi:hypothetical protein
VTITKLKILDTLIEQLQRMKSRPEPSRSPDSLNPGERVDALIEQYENQIRQVRAQSAFSPYAPAAGPVPQGAVFSRTA